MERHDEMGPLRTVRMISRMYGMPPASDRRRVAFGSMHRGPYSGPPGAHMRRRRLVSIVLMISAISCGGASSQSPSSGAPFPLFPMALVVSGGHDADEPIAVLGADGSISIRHRS